MNHADTLAAVEEEAHASGYDIHDGTIEAAGNLVVAFRAVAGYMHTPYHVVDSIVNVVAQMMELKATLDTQIAFLLDAFRNA